MIIKAGGIEIRQVGIARGRKRLAFRVTAEPEVGKWQIVDEFLPREITRYHEAHHAAQKRLRVLKLSIFPFAT